MGSHWLSFSRQCAAPSGNGPGSIDSFKFVAKGAKSHHPSAVKSLEYNGLGFHRLALPLRLSANTKPMERTNESLQLLTLTEAAQLLHVSTKTLQRMIRSGDLPALKVGGQWRLRESQLNSWIQSREGKSHS
jgi:excisionase family DNA binding protein